MNQQSFTRQLLVSLQVVCTWRTNHGNVAVASCLHVLLPSCLLGEGILWFFGYIHEACDCFLVSSWRILKFFFSNHCGRRPGCYLVCISWFFVSQFYYYNGWSWNSRWCEYRWCNVNEETISNQSGDTLLLTDEELGTVNLYADVLRNRECATPVQVTLGSQTDGTYFGHSCRFTDLDWNYFYHSDFDNVTPSRLCMAYFTSCYFVDSQAVFNKLVKLEIPRESLTCL